MEPPARISPPPKAIISMISSTDLLINSFQCEEIKAYFVSSSESMLDSKGGDLLMKTVNGQCAIYHHSFVLLNTDVN